MNLENLKNIQPLIDEYTSKNYVAGVNVLLFKDNKEVGYWQSGYADLENGKKYQRDTICRMYSMTKTITAVAAYKLIEQGKLDLGQDLAFYLPCFADLQVCETPGRKGTPRKAARPILIQDLLNMTSGYTYGAWSEQGTLCEHLTSDLINELNADAAGPNKITTQEFAQRISKIPVSFEPGTDYQYGYSADILGAVIEKIAGCSFGNFLNNNIFAPLGMKDTDFYVPKEKQPRLSNVYRCIMQETEKNDGTPKATLEPFTSCNLGISHKMDRMPAFQSGGAGLCSTIDDYARFGLMLVNGGQLDGQRILNTATVNFMSNAQLSEQLQQKFDQKMPHLSGYTYCNLLRIAKNPGECKSITTKGEYGWDGWLGPYIGIDPANNLVFVMTMQRCDTGTSDLTRCIKNIIYSSL
ncbi:MAG: beta-lactamase family protein [Treponema sp.]|nr:beta-lactamase family protein [Treponema sp.]